MVAEHAPRLHFVDDRLETLLAVRRQPDLRDRWKLYLATYGYWWVSGCRVVARATTLPPRPTPPGRSVPPLSCPPPAPARSLHCMSHARAPNHR